MERVKCEIREASPDDRGMLLLLAEETLHPLAEGAGHPERYHAGDMIALLERADVFVAECGGEPGGFVAAETDEDACAVRCICVNPGFEARGVANQLLDWVEGLAIERRLSRLVARVPADGHAVAAPVPRSRLQRSRRGRRDALSREAPAGGATEAPVRASLIAVPYDLGRAEVGSGRGPGAYLKAGAAEALRARGHEVEVVTVRREAPFASELDAVLEVDRAVAAAVTAALRDDALPLVVAGNCNVTLGVRAGLQHGGGADAALVWLDAHGDFNTPATTETGYLDGMPLAMLCGRAYREAVEQQLVMAPVREATVVHAGGRDFDREELESLLASAVRVVDGGELRGRGPAEALAPSLGRARRGAPRGDAARPGGQAAGAPARRHRRARPDGGARRRLPHAARPVRGSAAGSHRPGARALRPCRAHARLVHAGQGRGRDHAGRRPRGAPARDHGAGAPQIAAGARPFVNAPARQR